MSINPDEPVGGDRRKADNLLPSTNDNKSSTGSSDTAKVIQGLSSLIFFCGFQSMCHL